MAKRNQKNNAQEIEFTVGSGNVYADFGFPHAQEAKTKAELAILITSIIKQKKLTQQQAAELMGIDQPKVSKIIRGLLSEFTIERLMKLVLHLGFTLEIVPVPRTLCIAPSIKVNMKKVISRRKLIVDHITDQANTQTSELSIKKVGK